MWRKIWAALLTILAVFLPLKGAAARSASADAGFSKQEAVQLVLAERGYDTDARSIARFIRAPG